MIELFIVVRDVMIIFCFVLLLFSADGIVILFLYCYSVPLLFFCFLNFILFFYYYSAP